MLAVCLVPSDCAREVVGGASIEKYQTEKQQVTQGRVLSCNTSPMNFGVTGLSNSMLFQVTAREWRCQVNNLGDVIFIPVTPIQGIQQPCEQGVVGINVFVQNQVEAVINPFSWRCVVTNLGTITFSLQLM